MKKIAISGYYGFKNFGDELILSVLTEKLKDDDVTVFSVNPEFTSETYGVKSVKTFDPVAVVKTLWNTDVLISGGGSLFQDATSLKSLIYYAFVLGLAQVFRKKTIVFAQGIGPLKSRISRFLVKTLFSHCDSVSVRDEKSLELLSEWGINAELVADPAYSLSMKSQEKENVLGIQLREFSGMNAEFLIDLAHAVVDVPKIKLFSLQKSLDLYICEEFRAMVKALAPEKEIEIVEDNIIDELSRVDRLISMRFHALLIAMKGGVKCSVINYDPKVENLAEKYSLPLIEFSDSPEIISEKIKKARTDEVQACELHFDV